MLSGLIEGSGYIQSRKPLGNCQNAINRDGHVCRSPWWQVLQSRAGQEGFLGESLKANDMSH